MTDVQSTINGAVKSKTVWFSAAIVLLGAIQTQVDLVGMIGEKNAGAVLGVVGAIVAVLRFLTKDSLADKA